MITCARAQAPRVEVLPSGPPGVLYAVGCGNELTNGNCPEFPNCPPQVEPGTYAADLVRLRSLVDDVWAADPDGRPLVSAPPPPPCSLPRCRLAPRPSRFCRVRSV